MLEILENLETRQRKSSIDVRERRFWLELPHELCYFLAEGGQDLLHAGHRVRRLFSTVRVRTRHLVVYNYS